MYIHQDSNWPNFTWDIAIVNPLLIEVNRKAGFLSGMLSSIGFEERQMASVETITHDIVSSSEIEGVILNTEQVRSSVARRMGIELKNEVQSSRYIDGVVEMMIDAITKCNHPLTHERLFAWHNCLFPTGYSGIQKINVAKYRVDSMEVVSGMMGREKVHYKAPEPEFISNEMNCFLDWFNARVQNDYIKSAIAHFWFVTIHPFDDGNGRISRAIADMALSQVDDSQLRYFSMSKQISKEKKKYYQILEKSQKGDCDITLWVMWYLECMSRAIDESKTLLSSILNKAVFWQINAQTIFTDRQKTVLNVYLDGYIGKLTVKNWAKHAEVSPDTAARDIKDLVEKKILVAQPGKVRDTSYGIRIVDNSIIVPGTQI